MGDHANDSSIDDIIENETRQKARVLVEAELLREKLNDDNGEILDNDEEHLKQQLRQMRLGTSSEESNESSSRLSANRQNEQPIESYNPRSTTNFTNQVPYYAQVFPQNDRIYEGGSDGSSFDSNGQNSFDEFEPNNDSNKKPPLIQKLFGKNNIFNETRNSPSNSTKSSPLPWRNNKRSESPAKTLKSNPTPNSNRNKEMNGNSKTENPYAEANNFNNSAHLVRSYDPKPTNGNSKETNASSVQHKPNNVIRPPPPVPARPPHLAKKPKDKGFVQVKNKI